MDINFSHLVANSFNIISSTFLSLFLVILFVVMLKAGRKMDMTELFKNEKTGQLSHTKFWSNVAYFAATLAFLSLNLFSSGAISGTLEFIWIIYLGVVASNAVASKWISHKYNGSQENRQPEYEDRSWRRSYEEPAYKRKSRPLPSRVDNPDE